jgi:hypothetical protein
MQKQAYPEHGKDIISYYSFLTSALNVLSSIIAKKVNKRFANWKRRNKAIFVQR